MTRSQKLRKKCLVLGVIQALSVAPSFAATVIVDNSGETETACSLRNAIESINTSQNIGGCSAVGVFGESDTINFAVGAVSGLDTELQITRNISINPGGGVVTISANSTNTNRVLNIRDSIVAIENVIISGGRSGLRTNGGGIDAKDSQLSLRNVLLTDNIADGDGGGLYVRDSQVFIDNSRFTDNSAVDGGGIYSRDSDVTITDSIISSNHTLTGDDGGGLFTRSGTVSISNSTISDNSANDEGGGIFVTQSIFTLSNSTVSGNSVGDEGGGIMIDFLSNVSIIHSTVSNNTADRTAGGISVSTGTMNLSNSLIVGNSTGDAGLAVSEINLSSAGTLNFLGVNLVGDSSKTQAEVINFPPPNSVILATVDGSQATNLASIIAPLKQNQETISTHALIAASPAIDTANNAICQASPINSRDQRRRQRTELCDIGAFEFGATLPRVTIPPILFLLLDEND